MERKERGEMSSSACLFYLCWTLQRKQLFIKEEMTNCIVHPDSFSGHTWLSDPPQTVSSMSTPEDYCNLHLGIDSVKPQIDAVKLSSVLSPSAVELTHSNYLHDLIIIVFTDESSSASQHSRILKSSSRGPSLEDFGSSQFGPSVSSHCC